MRLSSPDRLKMNREMVAEQCPAQLPALTASTHIYLYKKDANFAEPRSLRFAGGSLSLRAATFDSPQSATHQIGANQWRWWPGVWIWLNNISSCLSIIEAASES